MSARLDADRLPAGTARMNRRAAMFETARETGAVIVAVPNLGGKFSGGIEVDDWRTRLCLDLHTREDLAITCGRRRARLLGLKVIKEAARAT